MAAEAMRAVFREPGPATARSAYRAAIDAVGAPLEDAGADALAHPGFPAEHGRRIRADNVRERMNREVKRGSRVVQVFPSPESTLRPAGAACAERDEGWSSGRYISPEPMLRLPGPAGPEPVESEASRRRGLMTVGTAMELAGTGGGRRDAMMQMDSGGGPFPNDGLRQLFRHYPLACSRTNE